MKAYVRLVFILISFVSCVACAAFCLFGIFIQIVPPLLTLVSVSSVLFGTFFNLKKNGKGRFVAAIGIVLALLFTTVCVGSMIFAVSRAEDAALLFILNL